MVHQGLIHQVLTSSEAAKKYKLSPNTVTQWCNRGRFQEGEARKSGSTWIVTNEGMERVFKKFGVRKGEDKHDEKNGCV